MNNTHEPIHPITSSESLIKWQVAQSNLERLHESKNSLESSIELSRVDIQDYNGAKILLEHLKNYKLEKRKDFILTIINSALKDIFESNYVLDIQPRSTKGKSAGSTQKYDIIFFQNGIEIAKNDDLLTSNGGGVLSIASLFFKILIGYLYSKNKFYIFDEALSQVSPQYRSRLSRFLRTFCEKYDFTIVVVSQTEELESDAHLVYEVESLPGTNNIPILNIKEVHGEYPTENYFYSSIKNFQSIVKQTFIYKGFTIIRGPNNSGKSASLRAIDAILFNNFKIETYPRKNPGGQKLTTEIAFGFKGDLNTPTKEVGLKYKSGKVMFIIEGEEYYGKSLAADKLKETVEEIGFKYIDVKKMYKNFKGPLKDQTERIAYTNQYDGLFLIGSKASDSEKIFSFLFNTENIALAIAQAKEQMVELNKEHKLKSQSLIEVNTEIISATYKVEYYLNLYYSNMINEFLAMQSKIINTKKKSEDFRELEDNIFRLTSILDLGNNMSNCYSSLISIRNKDQYNNTQIDIINQFLDLVDKTKLISEFIALENNKLYYEDRIKIMDQISPIMFSVQEASYYHTILTKIIEYKNWFILCDDKINSLSDEYNLCECSSCDGLGVHPNLI